MDAVQNDGYQLEFIYTRNIVNPFPKGSNGYTIPLSVQMEMNQFTELELLHFNEGKQENVDSVINHINLG